MQIKITIRTSKIHFEEDHLEVPEGSDVGRVLSYLEECYPERNLTDLNGLEPLIFRNAVMAYENTVLENGDEVIITPLMRDG